MKIEFDWTDGWILMAVYGAQREESACLADIIAMADVLNHAIATTDELNTSLTKFVQAGFMSVDQDRFTLAADVCAGLEAERTKRGGLFTFPDKAFKYLTRLNASRQNDQVVGLSEEQTTRAYDKYIEAIRPSRRRSRGNPPPT